jgi:hypothetical protein
MDKIKGKSHYLDKDKGADSSFEADIVLTAGLLVYLFRVATIF